MAHRLRHGRPSRGPSSITNRFGSANKSKRQCLRSKGRAIIRRHLSRTPFTIRLPCRHVIPRTSRGPCRTKSRKCRSCRKLLIDQSRVNVPYTATRTLTTVSDSCTLIPVFYVTTPKTTHLDGSWTRRGVAAGVTGGHHTRRSNAIDSLLAVQVVDSEVTAICMTASHAGYSNPVLPQSGATVEGMIVALGESRRICNCRSHESFLESAFLWRRTLSAVC
ncbi:hypothetical protein EDC04DRAFT_241619 [Pisolithus marmoratus]|nr:hypothetical protein EDC04DRAFT_241619 [Pisolithus marmoratus]